MTKDNVFTRKEYIEREAALELIDGIYDCNDMVFEKNDSCVGLDCGSCRWRDTKNYIRGRLAHIPAADAIEELICELADEHNARLDAESRQRWIPVSERLPESGERVLACCRVKWLGGGGRTYVCAAFHSAPKTETCVSSDDIDMEYDEETDEYYLLEGWWEVINNWDDYSFVAIGDFVTHWMPLPQPPKEKTE